MAQHPKNLTAQAGTMPTAAGPIVSSVTGPVNRKKAKRRAKQAARQAADQNQKKGANVRNGQVPQGQSSLGHSTSHSQAIPVSLDYGDNEVDDADQFEATNGDYYSEDDGQVYGRDDDSNMTGPNGHMLSVHPVNTGNPSPKKSKKKKKNKGPSLQKTPPSPHSQPPAISHSSQSTKHSKSSKDIWNTSTQEERQRIKEFWLELGEEERKSLVKIEKDAVLRKMKEQQKHSCSCTVCGRKRTAIEEELEVLYDAYYEELEHYANNQPGAENGAPRLPPPRGFGSLGRVPDRLPPILNSHQPIQDRVRELEDDEDDEDDEEGEEEYSDEDEDDDYSDEDAEDLAQTAAPNFFQFGSSLTVKEGILTVADDLLKNDGKKFIEMMEQLAERRMAREEEAAHASRSFAHSMHGGHNHDVAHDDEEYDDEDDEDYDSQEEDFEDEDEMDTMTEEQRMEEGRRMFQIFAARMFEQRVLTAYREKVALERQQKLLEEIAEESNLDKQREAKKALAAQKRKDKKALQKQLKAEEKARREAEKAAEEAAARAVEEKRLEEVRKKREEQRRKKEAERKAQEAERQKREAEKQRRLQEERERQLETERKAREQKAAEKKAREEARRKEREEREAREKEARERRAREEKEKKEREAKARADRDAREKVRKEEQTAQNSQQQSKRPSQAAAVPLPPSLTKQPSTGIPSPHVSVATPAIPKAPTPVKPRQNSQQGSHGSSPKTPQVAPGSSKSMSPASSSNQQQTTAGPKSILTKSSSQPQATIPQNPQPPSPMHSIAPPPGMHPPPGAPFGSMLPPGINGFPQAQSPLMHGMNVRGPGPLGHTIPMYPHQPPPMSGPYRPFPPPNNLPAPPPGMGLPPGMIQHGRGFPIEPPPGFQQMPPIGPGSQIPLFGSNNNTVPSHTRQQSASFDKSSTEQPIATSQARPIARPTPIQRPSSVKPQDGGKENVKTNNSDVEELSRHLGSSALLDDSVDPMPASRPDARRSSVAPGPTGPSRMPFGTSPIFPESSGQPRIDSFGTNVSGAGANTWGAPALPFGTPSMSTSSAWGNSPTSGWPSNNTFGLGGNVPRTSISRPVSIRLLMCQACRQLTASKTGSDGFHEISAIVAHIDGIRPPTEQPPSMVELLDICETEGDAQNGGGFFIVKNEGPNRTLVKYETDSSLPHPGRTGSGPGEIGSPLPGNSLPSFGAPRPFNPLGGAPTANY